MMVLILEPKIMMLENLEKTLDFYASVKSLYLQDRTAKNFKYKKNCKHSR